ncbi:MAG: alpha-mannosidase [Candidatus Hodarchaeota archaeon]
MKANNIIIVQETHWDREWYLPFQEFRARLVIMMDKLLEILKNNPNYKNFTLDGQTIPIEDYLEVRPEREEEIKKYVNEKRLSIGPMYILPDEFLISGESMIRNLLIGHHVAKKFGKVMKAGYIPDPFGHIAQLPQILSGFEIQSILFARGFGEEFNESDLNMEFIWNAPGKSASILAIHLILGYGSIAEIVTKTVSGTYKPALRRINSAVSELEKFTATPIILLNSGSDHHEARPEIPKIIDQWNRNNPDKKIEQNDFEYYIQKVLEFNPKLNEFQGELRGGKYQHLLSGVLSARMWIKQRNTKIEYLYEKYTEPISTIVWALDKYQEFNYPRNYINTGLKWLIKNHPHDSICGCSIDQVHNEMITRFDWAEQIGNEIFKDSVSYLFDLIDSDASVKKIALIVFNPLPWKRKDIVCFNNLTYAKKSSLNSPEDFKILDSDGVEVAYQFVRIDEEPRFTQIRSLSYCCTFLAEVPACGYNIYYVIPGEKRTNYTLETIDFKSNQRSIENEFYKISLNLKGKIDVLDKENGNLYEDICFIEDGGDWGDEYDFSGPKENQTDLLFTSEDLNIIGISEYINGPTQKSLKISANLNLPASLTEDRYSRDTYLVSNLIDIYISLYKDIKRIDFKIELENNSKDHRLRVLFPTLIESETVYADGHLYVVPRSTILPEAKNWVQDPLPTNHQKDFITISDDKRCFAVFNKGLPEYEAIINEDNTITFAITLLRCIEWLSRGDFATRKSDAGPDLRTPGAQCLGKHIFELSLVIDSKGNWLDSKIHKKGKEFNCPLKPIFPLTAQSRIRTSDKINFILIPFLVYKDKSKGLKGEPILHSSLSFLEIDNDNVVLSAIKKSEVGNYLILRVYNISSDSEKAILKFNDGLVIKTAEIVNLLEEKPINIIKANIEILKDNLLELVIKPYVLSTIKIEIKKE